MNKIIRIRHIILTLCTAGVLILSIALLFMSISESYSLRLANNVAYAGLIAIILLSSGSLLYQTRRVMFELKTTKPSDTLDADLVETEERELKSPKVLIVMNVLYSLLAGTFFIFALTEQAYTSILEIMVLALVGYSAVGNLADFIDKRI